MLPEKMRRVHGLQTFVFLGNDAKFSKYIFCVFTVYIDLHFSLLVYTAISIKVVPELSGKVEYEREKLAGSDD